MTGPTKESSPSSSPSPFHPALHLNYKNALPITLNMDKPQYTAWATLFRNTARAYQVLDHIDSTATRPSDVDDDLWGRLDSIVLQWIYGTIHEDLIYAILDEKATAMVAWGKLRDLFQDNKGTRIVHLENQFGTIKMQDFASSAAYCQSLKSTADQLSSLGHSVSEERLVLQLVSGLTDEFDTVATFIQQSQPLPSFQNARSMIALEETRRNQSKKIGSSTNTVLLAADSSPSSHSSSSGHRGGRTGGRPSRGRGGRTGGRGRGSGAPPPAAQPSYGYGPYPSHPYYGPPPPWHSYWAYPPSPYPAHLPRASTAAPRHLLLLDMRASLAQLLALLPRHCLPPSRPSSPPRAIPWSLPSCPNSSMP
ncbi:uncharacterized protein LOC125495055 [Beta vulgaris subsp. vulgaris]|nr:uncharacterized protein LOC125495055 [Beta vulgaris subsp. vulgaris]